MRSTSTAAGSLSCLFTLGNVKPRSMLKSVWRRTKALIFTIVCVRPKVRSKVGRSLLLGIHGQTELWLYGGGWRGWLKGYGWGYSALAFVESRRLTDVGFPIGKVNHVESSCFTCSCS